MLDENAFKDEELITIQVKGFKFAHSLSEGTK